MGQQPGTDRKVPGLGNAEKIIEFTDAPNGIYISK